MNSEKDSLRILATYVTPRARKICIAIATGLSHEVEIKRLKPRQFKAFFEEAFRFDAIVAVMATGIVVRGIAPFLKDKRKDPAVIVIDEYGRFVISLLSGHLGGANQLACEIAKVLDAQPVITTATDVNNLPALDIYAKAKGYVISDFNLYKRVAMHMLRGKKVPVFISRGESREFFKKEPFQILSRDKFEEITGPKVAVTFKKIGGKNVLFLVPKRLVLGLGFHRGLGGDVLYNFVKENFEKRGLLLEAVKYVATIDKRKGENGFLALCERLGASPLYFSQEELAEADFFEQSSVVKKYHMTGNICEAAAYLGSKRGRILVPKIKGGEMTLCIAEERYLS